ncbi:hypothetical protein DFR28_101707 [Arenicella xantha]|uniref:Uncharacterized protein n=1 Tax=Arenicella xantha TaxID=644221 RepID=A0A395JNU4_9GAMM|nr:hypothetical protein DFR28_101707 [Arenicella xantha]
MSDSRAFLPDNQFPSFKVVAILLRCLIYIDTSLSKQLLSHTKSHKLVEKLSSINGSTTDCLWHKEVIRIT